MNKSLNFLVIIFLIVPILLLGCNKQKVEELTEKPFANHAETEKQVEIKDEELPTEPIQAKEKEADLTTIPQQSKPAKPPVSSTTTQPKTNTQLGKEILNPIILASPDPSVPGIFGSNFNLENGIYPRDGAIIAKKDFTMKWSGISAPNYMIRVRDNFTVIFWAHIGNRLSYTFPASLFTEGHTYIIEITATTGTNPRDPNYKELRPINNSSPLGAIIHIRTLQKPIITYPADGGIVELKDFTFTWNTIDWEISGEKIVNYEAKLVDLTTSRIVSLTKNGRNAATVSKTDLISGHSYRFQLDAYMPGWNFQPENKQTSTITFKVQ